MAWRFLGLWYNFAKIQGTLLGFCCNWLPKTDPHFRQLIRNSAVQSAEKYMSNDPPRRHDRRT